MKEELKGAKGLKRIINAIQRNTHYSNKQLWKEFGDLIIYYKNWAFEEELKNIVSTWKLK